MKHVTWQRAGLAAVLLLAAGVATAGDQAREGVYWLGTGDWQLCERDGEAVLRASGWRKGKSGWLPADSRDEWEVSAPTIKSKSGKFLASDPDGRTPSVQLVKDKGANTRWVFDIVAKLEPKSGEGLEAKLKEGPSGFRFRVKMDEGPFKGWYLAAEETATEPKEEGKGKGPATRRLKLVRAARDATVFTYIEENYFVKHY
jgi:hypothetical protein